VQYLQQRVYRTIRKPHYREAQGTRKIYKNQQPNISLCIAHIK